MHQLGCCYEQGMGVDRDKEAAVKLYREGANLGYPDAMISLAMCLETGLTVLSFSVGLWGAPRKLADEGVDVTCDVHAHTHAMRHRAQAQVWRKTRLLLSNSIVRLPTRGLALLLRCLSPWAALLLICTGCTLVCLTCLASLLSTGFAPGSLPPCVHVYVYFG